MTARSFLVRGLVVGLLAGLASFLVAYTVGEPQVDVAISLEESAPAGATTEADDGHTHSHADDGDAEEGVTEVGRGTQRTWGLLTGTLAVGVALGGIVGLVAAATVGRLGRLTPRQSTATVSAIGFTSFALVPFLKYPATPPAVGSGDTIGDRTAWYFGLVLLSVVVAVLATLVAVRLAETYGAFTGVVGGAGLYVAAMALTALLLPTVNEVGAFPADTLWYFRLSSLLTLATLWTAIGVGLTGVVGRLHERSVAAQSRRELAASL
ncbi:CbtA family protein [Nocardioides sp. 503]|uniref:CbtA family protein n=1 Tax=Nocardioides sp. 503 TaxID=2508326 RepID=UPI00106FA522|nr:CbtA family protein [Nocardioides sp. 503]